MHGLIALGTCLFRGLYLVTDLHAEMCKVVSDFYNSLSEYFHRFVMAEHYH
jgi:hypothetical protein